MKTAEQRAVEQAQAEFCQELRAEAAKFVAMTERLIVREFGSLERFEHEVEGVLSLSRGFTETVEEMMQSATLYTESNEEDERAAET